MLETSSSGTSIYVSIMKFSLFDKISNTYKSYCRNFSNDIIHLINIHILCFLLLFIFKAITTIFGQNSWYSTLVNNLLIPSSFSEYLKKPWTIFTYFLVNEGISTTLFSMLLLYNASNTLGKLLDDRYAYTIYITGIFATGLFFVAMSFFTNFGYPLWGPYATIYCVLFACFVYAPNYPLGILFFGQVKLKYISIIFMLSSLSKLTEGRLSIGLTELFGAFWGFVFVKGLQQGIDIGKPVMNIYKFAKKIFVKNKYGDIHVSYKRNKKR